MTLDEESEDHQSYHTEERTWKTEPNFMAIHQIFVIQSGPKWWTDRTDRW